MHSTTETLGGWDEHTHIGQHWIRRKPEKGESGVERGKYWVSRTFTQNRKYSY